MAATFKLDVLTPETTAFSGQVEMVTLPGVEGEMGIYPMHAPLLTKITPGQITITQDGQQIRLLIGHGFAEVTADYVRVLTGYEPESADLEDAPEANEDQ